VAAGTTFPHYAHGPMGVPGPMALDFKSPRVFQAYRPDPVLLSLACGPRGLHLDIRYERRVLKLLAWAIPSAVAVEVNRRTCLSAWATIDRVIPEAKFVMTHRDPTDVILSVADVYADIVGASPDHLDRRYLGELNVQQWSIGMDRVVSFKRRQGTNITASSTSTLRAMQGHPIGEVRRLYRWLGAAGDRRDSKRRDAQRGGPI